MPGIIKVDCRLEEKPGLVPPRRGWIEDTYYLVEVAFSPSNPVHPAILAVGFLESGVPGGYSEVWCNTYGRAYRFHEVYYLKVIRTLITVVKRGRSE